MYFFIYYILVYMLWFNFIPGLNFVFLCFKLIIIHYHTQTQRKIKFKPRIKLSHNIYFIVYSQVYSDLRAPIDSKDAL